MNFGFWELLQRPFTVLAPMSGVTDAAFRAVIARYGKPDVMCTEFIPADGLCSVGRENLMHHLLKSETERPVIAQIYGANPGSFEGAAQFIAELGFDGVDINMGCPAKAVEKHGAGAALIRDPQLAAEIIQAAQEGSGSLPVSVKTRVGYSRSEIESWLACLVGARPAVISIHARTRDEESKVPARWEEVARAVEFARELVPDTPVRPLIVGNGDVDSLGQAADRAQETGCDGVMIGRGIFGNPWFFNPAVNRDELPVSAVIDVMLEHTELYLRLFGDARPIDPMRKHFKAYVSGFPGASELRSRLMQAESFTELRRIALSAVVTS